MPVLPVEIETHVIRFCDNDTTRVVRGVCKHWERIVPTPQLVSAFAASTGPRPSSYSIVRFLFHRVWLRELYARTDGVFCKPTVEACMHLYTTVYMIAKQYSDAVEVLKFGLDLKDELFRRYKEHEHVMTTLKQAFGYLNRKLSNVTHYRTGVPIDCATLFCELCTHPLDDT